MSCKLFTKQNKFPRSYKDVIISRFFTMFIIITFVSGLIYYYINKQNVENVFFEKNKEIVLSISENIDKQLKKMYSLSGVFSISPTIVEYLKNKVMFMSFDSVNDDNLRINWQTQQFIHGFMYYDPNLSRVVLLDKEKGFSDFSFKDGQLTDEKEDELRSTEAFNKAKKSNRIYWMGMHPSFFDEPEGQQYYIGFCKSVINFTSNELYGIIYAAYDARKIIEGINNTIKDISLDYIDYYVIDAQGKIIISKQIEKANKQIKDILQEYSLLSERRGIRIFKRDNRRFMIHHDDIEQDGMKLVIISEINSVYSPMVRVLIYTFIIVLISIAAFYLWSNIISSDLLDPVNEIVNVMLKVGQGDFSARVQYSSPDEFGYVATAVNKMVLDVQELIKNIQMKEKKMKEAEINALQLQINPHFMYNTLNAIKFLAMIKNQQNIANNISALINVLHSTFDYKKSFITVAQELDIIKNFVLIMQTRYNNKFNIIYDVDPEVMDMKIFKFMLQPVVENAIIHGVAPKKGIGNIAVKGYIKDNTVVFEVIDDGVGLNIQELNKQSSERRKSYNGIGIDNIDQRIKLYYGQPFGVSFDLEYSSGTRVVITIPLKGGYNNAYSIAD